MSRATVELMWCPLCREQLTLDWDTVIDAGDASPPTEHGVGECPSGHRFDVGRTRDAAGDLLVLRQRRAMIG